MRVDHQACQKAASTAGSGLLLQILTTAILLIFGLLAKDTSLIFALLCAWIGVVVGVGVWCVRCWGVGGGRDRWGSAES